MQIGIGVGVGFGRPSTFIGGDGSGGGVNLLTKTEQFEDIAWIKRGTVTITANAALDPNGAMTMDLLEGLDANGINDMYRIDAGYPVSGRFEPSFYIKKVTASGAIAMKSPNVASGGLWIINFALLGTGIERITRSHAAVTITQEFISSGSAEGGVQIVGNDFSLYSFYLWGFQTEAGTTSTAYQRVA